MVTGSTLDVSAVGSIVQTIGSEPLGTIQLDARARQLSDHLTVMRGAPDRSAALRRKFVEDIRAIEQAYEICVVWAREKQPSSPVADWLLDNFYVVREQIRDIRDHLPPRFFRELPKLSDGRARVHVVARELSDARITLERHVQSLGWNLAELRRLEQHRLAANQVSMGNIITSMRLIAALDWVSFFEQTNRAERILREDPNKVYAAMDFPSRNRYRGAIEQLSKRSGIAETTVAKQALQFVVLMLLAIGPISELAQ